MFIVSCLSFGECMSALGADLQSRNNQTQKGPTTDAEFKVELPDPYTLYFMHECGVLSG